MCSTEPALSHRLNPAQRLQPLQAGIFHLLPECSSAAGWDPELLCLGQLEVPNGDIGEVKFI